MKKIGLQRICFVFDMHCAIAAVNDTAVQKH